MKVFGIVLATVLVCLLGVYGGFVAANIMGLANQAAVEPAPPSVDCALEERQASERRDALRTELLALEDVVHAQRVEAGDGPRPLPPGAMPEETVRTLMMVVFGNEVELVHCREYPCVAVLRSAPSDDAMARLDGGSLVPRVVGQGPRWAIVVEEKGVPTPPRTAPRVAALLRILGRG